MTGILHDMAVPVHEHDCDECIFLANVKLVTGDTHDVYVCRAFGYPSYVVRHSDEPSDYASGPDEAAFDRPNPAPTWTNLGWLIEQKVDQRR